MFLLNMSHLECFCTFSLSVVQEEKKKNMIKFSSVTSFLSLLETAPSYMKILMSQNSWEMWVQSALKYIFIFHLRD